MGVALEFPYFAARHAGHGSLRVVARMRRSGIRDQGAAATIPRIPWHSIRATVSGAAKRVGVEQSRRRAIG